MVLSRALTLVFDRMVSNILFILSSVNISSTFFAFALSLSLLKKGLRNLVHISIVKIFRQPLIFYFQVIFLHKFYILNL